MYVALYKTRSITRLREGRDEFVSLQDGNYGKRGFMTRTGEETTDDEE